MNEQHSAGSTDERFIGGMGLADMAMRLAEVRGGVNGFWTLNRLDPAPRKIVNPAIHPVSAEYYRIIDRLARGEKP